MLKARRTDAGYVIHFSDYEFQIAQLDNGKWAISSTDSDIDTKSSFVKLKDLKKYIESYEQEAEEEIPEKVVTSLWDHPEPQYLLVLAIGSRELSKLEKLTLDNLGLLMDNKPDVEAATRYIRNWETHISQSKKKGTENVQN